MYLHKCRKQVHRDIKPDNVLVNIDGEVKLTDFGISKSLDQTLKMCNTFVGTTLYMSPERMDGTSYSYPGDIWSLGLVVIEMATGEYPYPPLKGFIELFQFIKMNPAPLLPANAGFSPEMRDFVERCMQKDPALRDTAVELSAHPWILKYSGGEDYELEDFAEHI